MYPRVVSGAAVEKVDADVCAGYLVSMYRCCVLQPQGCGAVLCSSTRPQHFLTISLRLVCFISSPEMSLR